VKPNKRIDTKISTPMFNLPLGAIASHDTPQALPQRNLLRHLTWSLPSGSRSPRDGRARHSRTPTSASCSPTASVESTPLWYYVLKEAELVEDGLHLGPSADGSSRRC
jgi:hypothetical protein